jgi:hypothetical protein
MSEGLRYNPESVANARPKEEQTPFKYADAKGAYAAFWNRGRKARRQTWADVEASAAFRQSIDEALEQGREKIAVRHEGQKIPWWVLLLALLGSIVGSGDDDQEDFET